MKFKALQSFSEKNGSLQTQLKTLDTKDLTDGDLLIKVHYSSINYKDALALCGRAKIFRNMPLIGGIDLAGTLFEESPQKSVPSQEVLVTGCDIGEKYNGGYSQYALIKKESVIPLPQSLTLKEAMILGTAGFTAALAIHRLENVGLKQDLGPIVITGASGGVGSLVIHMLAQLGYETIGVTSKHHSYDYLYGLGASKVVSAEQLNLEQKPLGNARYGAVVDNVGGKLLETLIPHINLGGAVACVGNAAGVSLNTTVLPFILRGVSLLGISSNNCPLALRKKLWQELAGRLKPKDFSSFVSEEVSLDEVVESCKKVIERKVTGRILVRCQEP